MTLTNITFEHDYSAYYLIQAVCSSLSRFLMQLITTYHQRNSIIYLFLYEETKYVVRINCKKPINFGWKNEALYATDPVHSIDYLTYDVTTGNYVRIWIEGNALNHSLMNDVLWRKLMACLVQFHHQKFVNAQNLRPCDLLFYVNRWLNLLEPSDLKLFSKLVQKYAHLERVISHNGLDLKNVLLTPTNTLKIIDFEWIGWNNPYFDIASLVFSEHMDRCQKQTQFSIKSLNPSFNALLAKQLLTYYNHASGSKLKYEVLVDHVYIVACFAYQWAVWNLNYHKQTKPLLAYQDFAYKQMKLIEKNYNLLIKYSVSE